MVEGASEARTESALSLADDAATDELGASLGPALRGGDVVFLRGPLGAGKTALARAIIRARLPEAARGSTEIPSPTYTLAQAYETDGADVIHADLYRLSDPDEAAELGLFSAERPTIALIEWPERLGDDAPARRLELTLDFEETGGRRLRWRAQGAGWDAAADALRRAT